MTDQSDRPAPGEDRYFWAKRKALATFLEISEVLGDDWARRIFAIWGNPPSQAKLNEIENRATIDRLDLLMKALATFIGRSRGLGGIALK